MADSKTSPSLESPPPEWSWTNAFDGGDTGCGELLVDLKLYFRALPGSTAVLVTARDAAAPVEMPAWGRMTGHALDGYAHPFYLFRTRKEDQ